VYVHRRLGVRLERDEVEHRALTQDRSKPEPGQELDLDALRVVVDDDTPTPSSICAARRRATGSCSRVDAARTFDEGAGPARQLRLTLDTESRKITP
jgi:hypothetical protein